MSAVRRCDKCGTEGAYNSSAVSTHKLVRHESYTTSTVWQGDLCERCAGRSVDELKRLEATPS